MLSQREWTIQGTRVQRRVALLLATRVFPRGTVRIL